MSERVPEGWEIKRLGDYVKLQGGNTFQSSDFRDNGIPIVRISNIRNDKIDLSDAVYYEKSKVYENFLIANGDILLAMSGATTGKIGRYLLPFQSYLNQRVGRFQKIENKSVCMDFIYQLVRSRVFSENILIDAVGGAQPNISSSQVEGIFYKIPPVPEQKKIASILTSVDEVIETTQKQIDKLQDLKKATMNELLTKGIGHTEFKDSELGRIPKSWEVSDIGKLTEFVTSGSRGWSQYYSSTGSLFIRIGNLTRDHINLKFEDIKLVDPPKGGEGTRTRVNLGDILVSITADLGIIGVVNKGVGEAYVNQHVCLVRLNQKQKVMPRWIGHFLSGHEGQEQFSKKNDGGAKAGLNLPTIRSVLVPIPSPDEQHQVVRILDRLDSEINVKQIKLSQTQSLKKSLMQDLLTGKVRVQVN